MLNKTYVISDLHAHTEKFNTFRDTLDKDDTVYVLGDTIDKGDGTLDVFLNIVNDPRFVPLMGNHELMMWQYVNAETTWELFRRSEEDFQTTWWMNDGERTYEAYCKLPKETQEFVREELNKLPLQKEIAVAGKHFTLSHTCTDSLYTDLTIQESVKQNGPFSTEAFLWEREFPTKVEDGKYVIAGHTPVQNYSEGRPRMLSFGHQSGRCYDIDCGLAINSKESKLGVLCLNDFSEHYF